MNHDVYGGFLTAGNNLQPLGDWLINQAITFGPGLGLATAGWIALRAWDAAVPRLTRRASTRRGLRRLEAFANHPAHRSRRNQQRKEKP